MFYLVMHVQSGTVESKIQGRPDWTVRDLQDEIQNLSGIAVHRQKLSKLASQSNSPVKFSWPCVDPKQSLRGAGLRSGDTILVEPTPASTPESLCTQDSGTLDNHDKNSPHFGLTTEGTGPAIGPMRHSDTHPSSLWSKIQEYGNLAVCPVQPCDPDDVGRFTRHEILSNNSCLFACISHLLFDDYVSTDELRHCVAQYIDRDPMFSDVMLEQPRDAYMQWIQRQRSWGGYIELIVLSLLFQVNIASYDIQTTRLDTYGDDFSRRIFLLYDGIHYDCLVAESKSPQHRGVLKVFQVFDFASQSKAESLVQVLHSKRQQRRS